MSGVISGAILLLLGGASLWRTDALIEVARRRHNPSFDEARVRRFLHISGRIDIGVGSFLLFFGIVSLTK